MTNTMKISTQEDMCSNLSIRILHDMIKSLYHYFKRTLDETARDFKLSYFSFVLQF